MGLMKPAVEKVEPIDLDYIREYGKSICLSQLLRGFMGTAVEVTTDDGRSEGLLIFLPAVALTSIKE